MFPLPQLGPTTAASLVRLRGWLWSALGFAISQFVGAKVSLAVGWVLVLAAAAAAYRPDTYPNDKNSKPLSPRGYLDVLPLLVLVVCGWQVRPGSDAHACPLPFAVWWAR